MLVDTSVYKTLIRPGFSLLYAHTRYMSLTIFFLFLMRHNMSVILCGWRGYKPSINNNILFKFISIPSSLECSLFFLPRSLFSPLQTHNANKAKHVATSALSKQQNDMSALLVLLLLKVNCCLGVLVKDCVGTGSFFYWGCTWKKKS